MLRFYAPLLALVVAGLCITGPGCTPSPTTAVADTTMPEPPKPKTFTDMLGEFKAQEPNCVLPDERYKDSAATPVGVDYHAPFVVGPDKIFPATELAGYKFYTRIKTRQTAFELVSFIEFRPDGSHYHLVTLTPEGKLIDRREVAFNLVGENFTHTKTAWIDNDLVIVSTDEREEIYVPKSRSEIRSNANPVQRSKRTGKETLAITPEGKFVVRQAQERL